MGRNGLSLILHLLYLLLLLLLWFLNSIIPIYIITIKTINTMICLPKRILRNIKFIRRTLRLKTIIRFSKLVFLGTKLSALTGIRVFFLINGLLFLQFITIYTFPLLNSLFLFLIITWLIY